MSATPDETPEPELIPTPKFLRPFLVLTISTVVLYASVLGMAIWTFSTGQSNKVVLCALKAEHERDIRNSLKFLEENPEGIPGISADLIARGIADDRQTLEAFEDLDCPSDP